MEICLEFFEWLVWDTSPYWCPLPVCCLLSCNTSIAVACTFWPQVLPIAGGLVCLWRNLLYWISLLQIMQHVFGPLWMCVSYIQFQYYSTIIQVLLFLIFLILWVLSVFSRLFWVHHRHVCIWFSFLAVDLDVGSQEAEHAFELLHYPVYMRFPVQVIRQINTKLFRSGLCL